MNHKILNKLPVGVAALISASTGMAASDVGSRIDMLENRMKQVGTENAFDGYGAQMAVARPSKMDKNWFVTADVLYWKPYVSGTEFAYTSSGPTLSYPVKGRTKDMDFDWDWGLRVGIGRNLDFDGWDIYAEYTYFEEGASSSTSSGCNNSIVMPLRGGICPNAGVDLGTSQTFIGSKAKSQFELDFDSIDLVLGRNYFVSHMLSLNPFFGAKTAWIDLEQVTRYCGPATASNFCGVQTVPLGPNTLKINEESDFWGIGPQMGMNTKWFLGKGFSFFANAQGSLLYGFFDVDHKEKYSGNDNKISLSANVHKMVPTTQIAAGVAYDFFFDDDKQHIGFSFGYDCQYWWRANQMIKIDDAAPLKYERWSEDLSFHGITIEGRWDF